MGTTCFHSLGRDVPDSVVDAKERDSLSAKLHKPSPPGLAFSFAPEDKREVVRRHRHRFHEPQPRTERGGFDILHVAHAP